MRRIFLVDLPLGLCLTIAFGLAGCGSQSPPAANDPPPVQVSYPLEQVVTDFLEFQGRTMSLYSVDVRAQVTGYLQSIYFTEGSEVVGSDLRPQMVASTVALAAPLGGAGPLTVAFSMNPTRAVFGDPLYLIDPDVYQANVAKADADLKTAEAATVLYKATYQITVNAKQGSSELDRTQALGQLQQAQAQSMAATATLDKARKDLGFCHIYAPLTGKIASYKVTPGNLIIANVTTLTNIIAVDPIWVNFDVDDTTMLEIQKMIREGKVKSYQEQRMPVNMGLVTDNGAFPHEGVVDFVDNKVTSGTGTILVRAKFSNPLGPDRIRWFTPGLFCRIRVALGEPQKRLLVAERAIAQNQGQQYVYVLNDKNEVVYRPVKLGRLDNGLRVILEGVQKQDKVIVNGMTGVRPGVVVRAETVDMPRVTLPPKSAEGKTAAQK